MTWRIIYRLDTDAIVIVEVFAKKTSATPKTIIESCQERIRLHGGASHEQGKTRTTGSKGLASWLAGDFLELTPEEAAFVETKLALTQTLRERRAAKHLTQHSLAKRLSSSQSRIAKMEAGDSSVSVDLLLRALFALGAKPRDIANALRRRRRVAA